jgi:hypothetical protein
MSPDAKSGERREKQAAATQYQETHRERQRRSKQQQHSTKKRTERGRGAHKNGIALR